MTLLNTEEKVYVQNVFFSFEMLESLSRKTRMTISSRIYCTYQKLRCLQRRCKGSNRNNGHYEEVLSH
jgi:hypothetical protein